MHGTETFILKEHIGQRDRDQKKLALQVMPTGTKKFRSRVAKPNECFLAGTSIRRNSSDDAQGPETQDLDRSALPNASRLAKIKVKNVSTSLPALHVSPKSLPSSASPVSPKRSPLSRGASPSISTDPEKMTTFDLSPSRLVGTGERELLLILNDAKSNQRKKMNTKVKNLIKSPSYLHSKRPEIEAKRLKDRWKELLRTRVEDQQTDMEKQKAAASAHQLLLRTIAKTCKLKPFAQLLDDVADFYQGVFADVFVAALSEKRLADESLQNLKSHQKRQKAIIIRHVERQHFEKMKKMMRTAFREWHEETVGKKKRIEGLQRVFLHNSRKAVLKSMFRQWFMCVKTWIKARKTAQSNLAQIDGRHDAEKRLMGMQDELLKMRSEVDHLSKTEDAMRVTAARRIKQLKASKEETLTVLKIVEECMYSTESDGPAFIEACKHQPNENRIENIRDAISSQRLRSVPKSVSIGTDMIDLVGNSRRQRRPRSSMGFHSSKEENEYMYFGDPLKKDGRRVPKLVKSLGAGCTHGTFALTGSSDYMLFI